MDVYSKKLECIIKKIYIMIYIIIISIAFILFIMTTLEAIATIKINKCIHPRTWWVPAIIGGIWLFCLLIYLQQ